MRLEFLSQRASHITDSTAAFPSSRTHPHHSPTLPPSLSLSHLHSHQLTSPPDPFPLPLRRLASLSTTVTFCMHGSSCCSQTPGMLLKTILHCDERCALSQYRLDAFSYFLPYLWASYQFLVLLYRPASLLNLGFFS